MVVDGQKNTFKDLIGNGSIVNVMYTPFAWEMNGKSGVTPILKKVQVVDLVAYAGAEDFDVLDVASAPIKEELPNDSIPF